MIIRKPLLILSLLVPPSMAAQERFTQRLQRVEPGKGQVILKQSTLISNLVDGVPQDVVPVTKPVEKPVSGAEPTTAKDADTLSYNSLTRHVGTRRVRMNGFRIQVYAGGNNRESKLRAEQAESRVSLLYPQLSTYTRFVSPRWICHLGDFRTREEALEVLRELRSMGGFQEAIIVKSKVNAWVE